MVRVTYKHEDAEYLSLLSPVAAHSFSAGLVLIAVLALMVHFAHARARRDTWLSADPATIAFALSMTSHSKFPTLLNAGDTDDVLSQKLKHMKFGISRRTWQVVAEDGEEEGYSSYDSKRQSEDRTMLLSGEGIHDSDHSASHGYTPERSSYPPTPRTPQTFVERQ